MLRPCDFSIGHYRQLGILGLMLMLLSSASGFAADPTVTAQSLRVAQVFSDEVVGSRPFRVAPEPAITTEDDVKRGPEPAGPASRSTYRTMCVRLCDGYFWPVSFSTTRINFARDADACASSCAAPTRLYTLPPDADSDQMVDLSGEPYSKLKVANLFRTSYNPSCKCKPHPWESAAQARHMSYAVAEGKAPAVAALADHEKSERPTPIAPEPTFASKWRSSLTAPVSFATVLDGEEYAQSRINKTTLYWREPAAQSSARTAAAPATLPKITYLSGELHRPRLGEAQQPSHIVVVTSPLAPPMGLGVTDAATADNNKMRPKARPERQQPKGYSSIRRHEVPDWIRRTFDQM